MLRPWYWVDKCAFCSERSVYVFKTIFDSKQKMLMHWLVAFMQWAIQVSLVSIMQMLGAANLLCCMLNLYAWRRSKWIKLYFSISYKKLYFEHNTQCNIKIRYNTIEHISYLHYHISFTKIVIFVLTISCIYFHLYSVSWDLYNIWIGMIHCMNSKFELLFVFDQIWKG